MSTKSEDIQKWIEDKSANTESSLNNHLSRADYAGFTNLYEHIEVEHRGRCFVELLQNCHDASRDKPNRKGKAWFLWTDSALLVGDNGSGFTLDDVESICTPGTSSKKGDSQTIGYKGVGFVAVYELSDCPEIYTHHGFGFGFDRLKAEKKKIPPMIFPQILDVFSVGEDKKQIDQIFESGAKTVIRLPFKEPSFRQSSYEDFLNSGRPEMLLFMPKIGSVTFTRGEESTEWVCKESKRTYGFGNIVTVGVNDSRQEWLVAKDSKQTPAKVKELPGWSKAKELKASVAIPWDKKKPRRLDEAMPICNAYPTEESVGFPILFNGDFLVTIDRKQVVWSDSPDSPTGLVKEMIINLTKSLFISIAKENPLVISELLETMHEPDNNSFSIHQGSRIFRKQILEALGDSKFVPLRGGKIGKPGDCHILARDEIEADGKLQAEMVDLVPDRSNYLDTEKLSLLAIEVVSSMGAESKPVRNFIYQIEPRGSDFTKVLKTLKEFFEPLSWQSVNGIRSRPVVFTQNNKWCLPDDTVDGSSHPPEVSELLGVSLAAFPKDKDLSDFLRERLGVETLSVEKIFEKIVERLEELDRDESSEKDEVHDQLLQLLKDLWSSDKKETKEWLEFHKEGLGGLTLPTQATVSSTKKSRLRLSEEIYFSKKLSGNDLLERLYGRFELAEFLADDLADLKEKDKGKAFFKALGVGDEPFSHRMECGTVYDDGDPEDNWFEYFEIRKSLMDKCSNPNFWHQFKMRWVSIDRIEEIVGKPLKNSSEALLEFLSEKGFEIETEVWCDHAKACRNNPQKISKPYSYMVWFLSTQLWVPFENEFIGLKDFWRSIPKEGKGYCLPQATKNITDVKIGNTSNFKNPDRPDLVRALKRLNNYEPESNEAIPLTADWITQQLAFNEGQIKDFDEDEIHFLGHSQEGRSWISRYTEDGDDQDTIIWDLGEIQQVQEVIKEPVVLDLEGINLSSLSTLCPHIELASESWQVDCSFSQVDEGALEEYLTQEEQAGLVLLYRRLRPIPDETILSRISNLKILVGSDLKIEVAVPGKPIELTKPVHLQKDLLDVRDLKRAVNTGFNNFTLFIDSESDDKERDSCLRDELVRLFPIRARAEIASDIQILLTSPLKDWGSLIRIQQAGIQGVIEELEKLNQEKSDSRGTNEEDKEKPSAFEAEPEPHLVNSPDRKKLDLSATKENDVTAGEQLPESVGAAEKSADSSTPAEFFIPSEDSSFALIDDAQVHDKQRSNPNRQTPKRTGKDSSIQSQPLVSGDPSSPPEDSEEQEKASLDISKKFLEKELNATDVEFVNKENLGWDISCVIENRTHYVEVKSTRGEAGNFVLTKNEVEKLRHYKGDYIVLFVTEITNKTEVIMYEIRDLHEGAEEFISIDYRVRPETWKKNARHFSLENNTNS